MSALLRRLRPRTLRRRLALFNFFTLAVMLFVFSAAVYVPLRYKLYAQLDHELREDVETAETLLERLPSGELRWRVEAHEEQGANAFPERWVEVWRPKGDGTSELALSRPAPVAADRDPLRGAWGPSTIEADGGESVRQRCESCTVGAGSVVIRAARTETPLRNLLGPLLGFLIFGLSGFVAMSLFAGYGMAVRALAPVARMTEQARGLTAERLSERLPVDDPEDEIGRLASTFNEMFARLERAFEQLRRFTADASHELRTPLTALRSVGEVGLREPRDAETYREIIGSMLEEADRLTRLVEGLLTLSRADAGHVKLKREPVDLVELARETVGLLSVLAEERRQALEVEAAGAVRVNADKLLLRQAILNLVDNAIKYTPEGGRIRVVVSGTASGDGVGPGAAASVAGASLSVIDTGAGIPAAHRERIFDRFYRVDPARSREQGGAGLGLSIARWGVEAHGGRIELESEEGRGSTFRVVLPGAAA
ncbi:MAG: heavy metal sensor histidine kinase [Planctomycetes bacterium]|nr:heavy metal sensor histidine kinase [Planctomycetota bacterium]